MLMPRIFVFVQALHNESGGRLHSIYMAHSPEEKKPTFNAHMDYEITQIKSVFPHVHYHGVADGSKENWTYLEAHTTTQSLDKYHANEYLSDYSKALYRSKTKQKTWYETHRKILTEQQGGTAKVLAIMEDSLSGIKAKTKQEKAQKGITYFNNNWQRMDYASCLEAGLPIGSGVIEAACKTIVKQRLGCSGMRWNREGEDEVLILRGLKYSNGRWPQFWRKIMQYGF